MGEKERLSSMANQRAKTDKPFGSNVEGISMKYTNEEHLHKKRPDVTLSLGLGPKGTTFTDQTPTPTQFIRNCEEVGLFQDLQNDNPFEETFKRAAEALKSGQPLPMEKFQSNPPDDTLHTPNIFPHIDVPQLDSDCLRQEISCEENLLKQSVPDNGKICSTTNIQPIMPQSPENPEGNINSSENPQMILNVPEGHFVQLITPDTHSSCNMVVVKNPEELFLPVNVKEKLKKSLSDKKNGKKQKVPILKCLPKKQDSLSHKFSKFTKNAMKLISEWENPSTGVQTQTVKKQKKIDKLLSKESRSEFLARNRAASSRCREKKKLYILYLEKVNGELSTENENLQIINALLRKEIFELHKELLKHKACSVADKNTEITLTTAEGLIKPTTVIKEVKTHLPVAEIPATVEPAEVSSEVSSETPDPKCVSFDVAEVILDEENKDSEIPLSEGNKPPDIIVRFNSVGNSPSKLPKLPRDLHLDKYLEGAGEEVKQIYSEHSYFFKKSIDVEKRVINYKAFSESVSVSPEGSKKLDNLRQKKSDAFRDITSLNTKILLEPRTPPPLLLLKPFKKRSIQNKQSEKSL